MTSLTLQRTHELTFQVESPILGESSGQTTTARTTASGTDSSYWTVTLSRTGSTLKVTVSWYHSSYTYHYPEGGSYTSMHLIPHNNPSAVITTAINLTSVNGTSSVNGSIDVNKVLSKDKYRFDIVLSTSNTLAHNMPRSSSTPSARHIMMSLLKDVHSVDICFVFTSDKSCSNFGLWAHRTILSRFKVFEELVQKATKAASLEQKSKTEDPLKKPASSQPASAPEESLGAPMNLTIQVDKFSLAIMCSILYYIYTGEVQLSINTAQYAISKAESALVLYDTTGKTRESIRWDPLDADSAWKLKDVTWEELSLAAAYYGLDELQARCEKEVVQLLDETNVIDILFHVGSHVKDVKNQALDYIAEHMDLLFVDGKDPFDPFKDHPRCHEMLVEVMRVKATKKAST